MIRLRSAQYIIAIFRDIIIITTTFYLLEFFLNVIYFIFVCHLHSVLLFLISFMLIALFYQFGTVLLEYSNALAI